MAQPDYDWELDSGLNADVSCVSLGSYCAVASALNHLKLRTAAYPFDWNRTTIEGVIHFLSTRFADFLHFWSVKDFEGGLDTGGKAYCGAHHSIWHENLASGDGTSKYERRIARFYENGAPKMLFVRSLNSSAELGSAATLLRVLQGLFPKSHVYLLVIVCCQPAARSFAAQGTNGRLLVHCTPQWSLDGLLYVPPIRAAYERAATLAGEGGAGYEVRPLHEILWFAQPYWGGHPQQVPFSPQLLPPMPRFLPPPPRPALAGQAEQRAAQPAAVAVAAVATAAAMLPAAATAAMLPAVAARQLAAQHGGGAIAGAQQR